VIAEIGRFLAEHDYRAISGDLGLFAIVPLVALLIERELFRAYEPNPDRQSGVNWMTAFIVPLMGALILIMALRLLHLVGDI
jgi:hypothetical protein